MCAILLLLLCLPVVIAFSLMLLVVVVVGVSMVVAVDIFGMVVVEVVRVWWLASPGCMVVAMMAH